MAETTQSPPAERNRGEGSRSEVSKPLPVTEPDLHWRSSRTNSAGFRIGVVVAVLILLVVGYLVYHYVSGYQSTDDAQVDGHVNSVSGELPGTSSSSTWKIINTSRLGRCWWSLIRPIIR